MTEPAAPRGSRLLVTVAVLLLAINLRPVVNSLGAVIPELRDDTGLSPAATGVLLSLPTLTFAFMGLFAPALAARFGPHRTVVVTLLVLIAGQVARAALPGTVALFAGSLLALTGIAVGNVVLPGLVRLHFPDRIPAMTAAYTTLLTIGGAAAAALSNPVKDAFDADWRFGIGIWAGTAVIALIPWLALVRGSSARPPASSGTRLPLRVLARTSVAWTLAGYFGLQSMLAYVIMGWMPEILTDTGMTQTEAAFQVAIVITVGIPLAALVPPLLGRSRRPAVLVVVLSGCYLVGFVGLAFLPGTAVLVFSVFIGIGTGAFPLALTLIPLRSRTALATTSLSAFTQCVGYLIASVGPIGFGVLFEVTGGWTVPLLALCGGAVAQAVLGALAVRRRTVEDELPESPRS